MQTQLYGIIYAVRAPNGKKYIGQTIRTLSERRRQHEAEGGNCPALEAAIRKHGDAMRWEVIACASDKDDLDFAECALIRQHNTLRPHGYNLTDGGGSGKPCVEARAKMSAAARGRKFSPQHRAKMSEARRGKKFSAATRAKIGAAHRGKFISATTRAKMSAGHIGICIPHTAASRAKMSEAHRGKVISADHRAKISATLLRRAAQARAGR